MSAFLKYGAALIAGCFYIWAIIILLNNDNWIGISTLTTIRIKNRTSCRMEKYFGGSSRKSSRKNEDGSYFIKAEEQENRIEELAMLVIKEATKIKTGDLH